MFYFGNYENGASRAGQTYLSSIMINMIWQCNKYKKCKSWHPGEPKFANIERPTSNQLYASFKSSSVLWAVDLILVGERTIFFRTVTQRRSKTKTIFFCFILLHTVPYCKVLLNIYIFDVFFCFFFWYFDKHVFTKNLISVIWKQI